MFTVILNITDQLFWIANSEKLLVEPVHSDRFLVSILYHSHKNNSKKNYAQDVKQVSQSTHDLDKAIKCHYFVLTFS